MSASRFASVVLTLLLVAEAASGGAVAPSDWPRFRGPNGQGVAPDDARPPSQFGTDKNLAWATELPPGHSSPVVAEGRIFLTACHEKKLETICLDAATGNILWRRPAPSDKIEDVNSSNSPAASTPVTDGERVYVYFGSFGLVAYDQGGAELWKVPVPTPQNLFGTGTSPIVVAGNVVLVRDSDAVDSSVFAVDRKTGK